MAIRWRCSLPHADWCIYVPSTATTISHTDGSGGLAAAHRPGLWGGAFKLMYRTLSCHRKHEKWRAGRDGYVQQPVGREKSEQSKAHQILILVGPLWCAHFVGEHLRSLLSRVRCADKTCYSMETPPSQVEYKTPDQSECLAGSVPRDGWTPVSPGFVSPPTSGCPPYEGCGDFGVGGTSSSAVFSLELFFLNMVLPSQAHAPLSLSCVSARYHAM